MNRLLRLRMRIGKLIRAWLARGLLQEVMLRLLATSTFLRFLRERTTAALRLDIFRSLGREAGISSIVCEGSLGSFEGLLADKKGPFDFYLRHKTWAPNLQSILADDVFRERAGTLIDVGAHIGLTSIPIAKSRGVRCYCFEPEPRNFALLQRNVSLNQVGDLVTSYEIALAAHRGSLPLRTSADNLGDHRIAVDPEEAACERQYARSDYYHEEEWPQLMVAADTLDALLGERHLEPPVVIKLDTQGYEVQVVRGGDQVLRKAEWVIVEFWPYALNQAGSSVNAFLQAFRCFPYGSVLRDEPGRPDLRPMGEVVAELSEEARRASSLSQWDVIFSRTAGWSAP